MLENKISHSYDGLGTFFEDYAPMSVPDYQRGFDWNQSHVEELWEDLHYYVEKELAREEEEFFLGTIILKSPATEKDRYQIVDGQQRLTSIYLLAIVLRDRFKEIDTNTKRDVDTIFLNSYDIDENRSPKFLGNQKIRDVLKHISDDKWDGINFPTKEDIGIDGRVLSPINKKLKACIKAHEDELDGNGSFEKKYDDRRLKALLRVLRKVRVITLRVSTDERAFYLFETTNARGKDLEPGDLLKNHLFAHIKTGKEEIYSRWDDVVENSAGRLTNMLRHFYYVQNRHVQKKELFKKLRKLKNASKLLEDLESYSEFHNLMHKGDFNMLENYLLEKLNLFEGSEYKDKFKSYYLSISALRFFKTEQAYPLLYAFLKRLSELLKNDESIINDDQKKKLLRDEIKNIFKAFENFQFINYKISGNKANKIEKPYAQFAGVLYKSKNAEEFLSNLETVYKFLRTNINSYEVFRAQCTQISYEDDKMLIHYIFHKIEANRIKKEETKNKDWNLVDPIFPRSKTLNWDIDHWMPRILPNEKYSDYFDAYDSIVSNDQVDLIHNIGNLSIMHNKLNQKLSNQVPCDKLEYINKNKNSNKFYITRYLDDFDQVVLTDPGDTHFKESNIVSKELLNTENEKMKKNGKKLAKFKKHLWDAKSIYARSGELAHELFHSVFAIGDGAANFPKITSEKLSKFKK
jgi:uncharacterized protein with ParB-like and HNH nuclease domain